MKDAISHCSMVGLSQLFRIGSFREMSDALMVDVTIATPNPEKVDGNAVLSVLPEGERRINVVEGGMSWPAATTADEARSHRIVMANAVIMVLVDADRLERK